MNISQQFKDMIADLLPSPWEQESFFQAFQQPLKKSLSINRHRDANFENNNPDFILNASPFEEVKDTKYVDREDTTIALGKTRQHLTGQFYIQEVAASLPANILKSELAKQRCSDIANQPANSPTDQLTNSPIRILDLCAAPWGKTAQLADYLLAHDIPGVVRGNDVDAKRLSTRASNIQRCGLYNTVATKLDGSQIGNLYPEYFDAILVDAPCSGEGTGFKSDAAYKWWKSESINKIVWLQEHIVTSAIKACKPGWIIIYSTCTLNPFENEMQIAKLLEKYGDTLEIVPIGFEHKSSGIELPDHHINNLPINSMLRCRPHIHHTGWFFVCVMRKQQSTLKPLQEHITKKKKDNTKQSVKTPFSYNKQGENTVKKVLQECFGIELDLKHYAIIEWKHKLNLTDASVRDMLSQWVWLHECGVPLMKPTGKTFSIEHECSIALWHLATKNTIELTTDELQRYCLGEDIAISQERLWNYQTMTLCNWYVILIHHWLWVWVWKIIDGTIKNKFMKW